MGRPRKAELRERKKEEQTELVRVVKATREGQDAVKRAKALLAVAAGATLSVAGQEADLSREAVAQLVSRFNQRGLAVLETAFGGGRRPTSTSEQRARILTDVQRTPDRKEDQTVTGSWMLRRDALRKTGLPQIAAETIREVRHEAGESSQRTRTWCRTGDALRTRTSGTVMVSDLETPEKNDGSSWRASTRKPTGLSNARKTKRDPLKPSHNLGRRGSQRAILQHTHTRYERGGTAHMFTLFRPAPGERRATGVRSAPSAVVHPWLIEHLSEILAEIEKKHPQACLPREEDRPVCARWETWPGHPRQCPGPSLRIVLVLDTLAGHRSYDLGRWFVDQGVMPLCTPIGGSWLNMAESVHRLLVPRALAGQHPKNPQESSDW